LKRLGRVEKINRFGDEVTVVLNSSFRLRLVLIRFDKVVDNVVTEDAMPLVRFKVRKGFRGRHNSSKPIIKDNAPLRSDGACAGIEDKGSSHGVLGGEAHVDESV
jgi:hypothetical protein